MLSRLSRARKSSTAVPGQVDDGASPSTMLGELSCNSPSGSLRVSMKKKNWPALFNKGVAKLREEDKLSAKKKEEIRVCVCVFSFRTH